MKWVFVKCSETFALSTFNVVKDLLEALSDVYSHRPIRTWVYKGLVNRKTHWRRSTFLQGLQMLPPRWPRSFRGRRLYEALQDERRILRNLKSNPGSARIHCQREYLDTPLFTVTFHDC